MSSFQKQYQDFHLTCLLFIPHSNPVTYKNQWSIYYSQFSLEKKIQVFFWYMRSYIFKPRFPSNCKFYMLIPQRIFYLLKTVMIIKIFVLHIKNISHILLIKTVLFHIKPSFALKLLSVYVCVTLKDSRVTLKS